ncbi:MAG TPA: IPT/TIG domain-containing protein [Pantanalinema sp.]
MSTRRLILFILSLALAGCQALRPNVPNFGDRAASGSAIASASVHGRLSAPDARQAQALPSDVVNAATVSFIDAANTTVATGKTDASGNFSLSLNGYAPANGATYILEAVKGLNNQAPGSSAARFRTLLQWNGTGWLSCSNGAVGGGIVINALTTALAIACALDPVNVPPAQTMGKVNAGTTPATLAGAPVYTNHPDAEIAQLATDLLSYLGANQDPLASVPAIKPSITTFSPSTAGINALVQIQGTGFSPVPSGNTVSFNGVPGQVVLAAPTYLVAAVPSGASSGGITVATARGSVTSGGFTLSLSGAGAGGLVVSSFSPAYGRAGTEVVLSGQFGTGTATPTVTFKGPASDPVVAPVSAWSANAMTVTVPTGAVPGGIGVQSGMATAQSSAPFDVWQGEVSLMNQVYSTSPGGAYQLPNVNSYHTVISSDKAVYMLGGTGLSAGGGTDVFMFAIRADGSLAPAMRVSSMINPRYGAPCAIVGNYMFALGGQNAYPIERAEIYADGTLGPWESTGVNLQTNRYSMPAMVKGNDIYLVSSYTVTTIERYTVDGSGNISRTATYPFTVGGVSKHLSWYAGMVVGSSIVLVGGELSGGKSAATITLPINADGSIGDGVTSAYNLPQTEYAPGGWTVASGSFYVWGGYNGTAYTANVYRAPINTATGQLTGAWVADGSLRALSSIVVGTMPVTAGNRLWALGGASAGAGTSPTAIIQTTTIKADGSLNAWSYYGGMTSWRFGCGVHTTGNKIWLVGGSPTDGSTAASTTECFAIEPDGTLGPSTVGPSLKTPRYKGESFVVERGANRYLYAVGGSNGGTYLSSVERARINPDGTLGAFEAVSSALVVARSHGSGAVIGDYFYYFAGTNGSYQTSIERARINPDGSLGAFELLDKMLPDARTEHRAVVVDNYVYVIGSYNGAAATGLVYMAPIYPDGTLGAFTRGPNLLTAVYEPVLAKLGNYLYAFGGSAANVVQRALINPDGTLNAWQAYRSDRYVLPFNTGYANDMSVFGNTLFLFSGYNGGVVQAIAQGTVR